MLKQFLVNFPVHAPRGRKKRGVRAISTQKYLILGRLFFIKKFAKDIYFEANFEETSQFLKNHALP